MVFEQRLKPINRFIDGNSQICSENLIQEYKLVADNSFYYEWSITGGSIYPYNITDSVAMIEWDPNASEHKISAKAYSPHWAEGDVLEMELSIIESGSLFWQGLSPEWDNRSNWNVFCLPQYCHNIIIEGDNNNPIFPHYKETEIQSLLIKDWKILTIGDGGKLTVT
jgi:hypothetical protein